MVGLLKRIFIEATVYGKPVGFSPDWTNISKDEIMELANKMFDAASVPKKVRDEYFELFDIFIMEVL